VTDLQGKVVVVTGAARGQGEAEVATLIEAGARVVACDRTWPDGTEFGYDVTNPRLRRRELDVTDEAGWLALADEIRTEFGHVHGLVNNAGIALRSRLGDVEVEAWNRVFAINVTGPMLGIQALFPLMDAGGSIVNVGSLAAVTGHAAVAYTASKWALRGLSRAASMQLGAQNIRVNLINPGFIETPMTDAAPDSFRRANLLNTSLGRAGVVSDVAPLVAFLISDDSSFISGAEIPVDGGQWAHGGAKFNYDFEKMASA
jgi:3alpha(or 20beta)-hydroxysteroid dehydrogenase